MLLSLSKNTIAADITLPLIAILGVVLRMLSRKEKRVPIKADDYTIVLALVRVYLLVYCEANCFPSRPWPLRHVRLEFTQVSSMFIRHLSTSYHEISGQSIRK